MKTSEVIYIDELRTECTHLQSGEKIIADAPIDNQGKGQNFSPTDMLATSLASCMLTIIGIFAQRGGFSINGAKATVTKVMGNDPRRVSEVHIDIDFPKNNYSEKEKKIIQVCVETCPVAKSLHPEIKQIVNCNF